MSLERGKKVFRIASAIIPLSNVSRAGIGGDLREIRDFPRTDFRRTPFEDC